MKFLILSKEKTQRTENLYNILSKHGSVKIIEDIGEEIKGYTNLCSELITKTKENNKTTSWDRAFVDIEREYTWLIEDDVAATEEAFAKLFDETKDINVDLITINSQKYLDCKAWYWWRFFSYFEDQVKSFNPICRLSPSLIDKVLEFREKNNGFVFHEMLFASLADSIFDMSFLRKLDFSNFTWDHPFSFLPSRINRQIFHPIKQQKIHSFISEYK